MNWNAKQFRNFTKLSFPSNWLATNHIGGACHFIRNELADDDDDDGDDHQQHYQLHFKNYFITSMEDGWTIHGQLFVRTINQKLQSLHNTMFPMSLKWTETPNKQLETTEEYVCLPKVSHSILESPKRFFLFSMRWFSMVIIKFFLEGYIRDHSLPGVRGCMQSWNRKKLLTLNGPPPPPSPSTTMQDLLFNIHAGANSVISFLLFYHFTRWYPLAIRCLPE